MQKVRGCFAGNCGDTSFGFDNELAAAAAEKAAAEQPQPQLRCDTYIQACHLICRAC